MPENVLLYSYGPRENIKILDKKMFLLFMAILLFDNL
jgi:hypothetical protein